MYLWHRKKFTLILTLCTARARPPKCLCLFPLQVTAAMKAAHQSSLQLMSKRLAELYGEMGLPMQAGPK